MATLSKLRPIELAHCDFLHRLCLSFFELGNHHGKYSVVVRCINIPLTYVLRKHECAAERIEGILLAVIFASVSFFSSSFSALMVSVWPVVHLLVHDLI